MADSTPMLTPLRKSGHNFKTTTAAGAWEPISGTLGELGRALDVDEKAAMDVVRSTPDPWSQARSFADAVLYPTDQGRAMVAEWRGLLALFGLASFYADRYSLEFVPVDLGGSSSRFAEVMRRLLPGIHLPTRAGTVSHGWERPVIVRLVEAGRVGGPGHDLGMLNPACLVAGGRDLGRLRVDAISWMRRGLTDPAALAGADALPPAALQILQDYLRRLRNGVVDLCSGADDEAARPLRQLSKALETFADGCTDAITHPGVLDHRFDLTEPGARGEDLPALYALLTRSNTAKEPEPGTSDCILEMRQDLGEDLPVKGLVLLDPAIATPDRPANSITFWGLSTLEDALNGGASALSSLRERISAAGYLLIQPDNIFTRILARLDDAEQPARIPSHPDTLQDCLLPLSPLALLLRAPDDLRGCLSLSADGRVVFDVRLGGRKHSLVRRFVDRPGPGQGRMLREVDWGLGDVAVWPNFTSDRWTRYCARIDFPTNGVGRLRGRFAASGRMVANLSGGREADASQLLAWGNDAAASNQSGQTGLDRVKAFAERGFLSPDLTRFRASASGGRTSEIQVATTPFEAFFFTVAADADTAPVPAGMALLQLATVNTATQHEKTGNVAIDFGTTNTVACLDEAEPLVLEARIAHPIRPAKGGGAIRPSDLTQKLRDFLPADERRLPSPTVTLARPVDADGRNLLDADLELVDALLVRHLMYFQPDYAEDGTITAVPLKEWSALLNSITYDLKWSGDAGTRDVARRYLRQLMLMIACEWAAGGGDPAKLQWYFSRPHGMGERDDDAFPAEMRRALAGVVPNPPEDAVRRITKEADAAAAYILQGRTAGGGTRGKLNVILDIGGGTTDVAVWDNAGGLVDSFSLRMAGGDFFTDHVMSHPEILTDFGLKSWTGVVQQMAAEPDASLKANIHYVGELLFSGKTLDQAIDRSWSRISGTENVRSLKETAYVFLGGVAWFVGRRLRDLVRNGRIDEPALKDVAVAFCGRGSGLFTRLHGSDPLAKTDISRLLLLVAVAAGDTRPSFPQVQVSPFPKIEVAGGMIVLARSDTGTGPKVTGPSDAGLNFGAIDESPLNTAGASDEAGYTLANLDVGMEDLDPFLRAFAKATGLTVTISDHQRAKLTNGVADLDQDDARAGRVRQPEFAAMLKVLIGLIRLQPGGGVRPETRWR